MGLAVYLGQGLAPLTEEGMIIICVVFSIDITLWMNLIL
jgi:hypothetical protein